MDAKEPGVGHERVLRVMNTNTQLVKQINKQVKNELGRLRFAASVFPPG